MSRTRIQDAERTCDQLREKLQIAREALEFIYKELRGDNWRGAADIQNIARAALEKLDGGAK